MIMAATGESLPAKPVSVLTLDTFQQRTEGNAERLNAEG
jgi:hypothetical protein